MSLTPGRPSVIALWGPPRSLSTAFTRMMMERKDLVVLHEPLSNLLSVGHFDVAGTRAHTPGELFDLVLALGERRTVFFKDTTEYRYLPYLEEQVVHRMAHTFIVRDPAAALASHYAVNPELTLDEGGYELQAEVYDRVREVTGTTPPVIDAADLLVDPARVVRAYCEAVGLPYLPEALSWSPEARSEWKRTEHWHQDVSSSSTFRTSTNVYDQTVDNNELLARYRDHHQPFYDLLAAVRIGSTVRDDVS
ncbi:sulfotransferase family protein [Streptomyces sp. NPDC016172]|uniref:sulfotransferase-like domain-containing protein n=1 Tax=Streptomyces sp. NPDC016172 TaxID=3364964 RepID=UPI00370275C2